MSASKRAAKRSLRVDELSPPVEEVQPEQAGRVRGGRGGLTFTVTVAGVNSATQQLLDSEQSVTK